MWGCGLKYSSHYKKFARINVTPYVGVWIEICGCIKAENGKESPPMWGCGLKSSWSVLPYLCLTVTPYVGVWIEISIKQKQRGRK